MRVASRKSIRNAQTSALNAFQHGLSGSQQRLRLATQSALQFVQIIKGHNRLVAIENNILHIGGSTTANPESTNSDRVECMVAQARTGTKESDLIDKIGRHESSRSQLLLQYRKEIDRIQTIRRALESSNRNIIQTFVNKQLDTKSSSFCKLSLRQFSQHSSTTHTRPDKLNLHQCQTAQPASHP